MNKMATIIGFTFKNKVRTKSFMITTLILVLLLSIGMNIPYLIKVFNGEDGAKDATQIGIVAEQGFRPAELLLAYTPLLLKPKIKSYLPLILPLRMLRLSRGWRMRRSRIPHLRRRGQ